MMLTLDTYPTHSVSEMVTESTAMLWIDRGGAAAWEVRAVLMLSDKRPDEHIAVNCRVGSPDGPGELGLVGLAKLTDSDLVHVRRAWRINPLSERFEEVPANTVFCLDEAFYERERDDP